jgi:hypothetical protein
VSLGPPIRPIIVYTGRRVPTVHLRGGGVPGWAVIATEAAYTALAAEGLLGPPVLTAVGRVGNVARGRVVLAESRAAPGVGEQVRDERRSGHLAWPVNGVPEAHPWRISPRSTGCSLATTPG